MKPLLSLLAVLTAGTLALGQATTGRDNTGAKPANANSIDGTWTVISAEKNGQPMADARDMTVTVKDNTITCSGKDGKPAMTLKVEFAGIGHARVTDQSATLVAGGSDNKANTDKGGSGEKGTSREAVYVLTNDYLAVCVHDDKAAGGGGADRQGGAGTAAGSDRSGSASGQPSSKSYCTIILKRNMSERK